MLAAILLKLQPPRATCTEFDRDDVFLYTAVIENCTCSVIVRSLKQGGIASISLIVVAAPRVPIGLAVADSRCPGGPQLLILGCQFVETVLLCDQISCVSPDVAGFGASTKRRSCGYQRPQGNREFVLSQAEWQTVPVVSTQRYPSDGCWMTFTVVARCTVSIACCVAVVV